MKSFLIPAICFVAFCQFSRASAQNANSDSSLRRYNSFNLFFADNSKLEEGGGLLNIQIFTLDSIAATLARSNEVRNIKAMFLTCNGTSAKPEIRDDFKSHDKWMQFLYDENAYMSPQYFFDVYKLRDHFTSEDPFLAGEVNIFYFFSENYIVNQFNAGNDELAKYINVLPRELATLLGCGNEHIHVYMNIPSVSGQIAIQTVRAAIENLAKFKSNDVTFLTTTFLLNEN